MKFLCDEMLGRLGRWLRAAGYDTVIAADGMTDAALLTQARDEGRRFLTRDRKILEHKDAARHVTLLSEGTVAAQARWLTAELGINWHHAPFSRCLVCNTALAPAPRDARDQMPPRAQDTAGPVMQCPGCGRVYWRGSHYRRMKGVLHAFAKQA